MSKSICLMPKLKGVGGPSSFQRKLKDSLAARSIDVHYDPDREDVGAVLVTGGTRNFSQLAAVKRRGIRIVQRLDGMNWLHKKTFTGVKHFLRAQVNNYILSTIRKSYADYIVYQSYFTQSWWNRVYGPTPVPNTVVHNGVDLTMFSPKGREKRPKDFIRIMVIEGSFYGGHQRDLHNAVGFAHSLAILANKQVELKIASKAPKSMLESIPKYENVRVDWLGLVPLEQIPILDRSAHMLFPAEINAACPNTVVEAMACGLPIVSFDTGSLSELVADTAGMISPYGSNHWDLEVPDFDEISKAGLQVFEQQAKYRKGARERAEHYFDMHQMAEKYLQALLPE